MLDSAQRVIYQLKVVLLGISPMIWRRILVSSDSTIKDLHYTIQLAMGWEDIHLHHFIIYGKYYGITQPGGTILSDRACEVKLFFPGQKRTNLLTHVRVPQRLFSVLLRKPERE
jgi:hypothetical protein